MKLADVLQKYVRIFNVFGESCVMLTDSQQKNPTTKKRLLTYAAFVVSFILSISSTLIYLICALKYNKIPVESTTRYVTIILVISLSLTKLVCISQMHLWLKLHPILFQVLREIERITAQKYEMNFKHMQTEFHQDVNKVFILCIIKFAYIITFECISWVDFLLIYCSTVAIFLGRITICHVFFYVLLYKHIISIHVDYMTQKVIPNNLSDLKSELIFFKIMHFKFHEIANNLNATFGWMFIAIFIEGIIDITANIYWMFLYVVSCSDYCKLMRK